LKGEYAIPSTPRGWFRSSRQVEESAGRSGYYPSNTGRLGAFPGRRTKKRLILSQSVVIDVDSNKVCLEQISSGVSGLMERAQKSDQAESVILHHDIIHNPATCFHFELHWIGTTARCIDDQLRQWSRTIERYGLKLVEAYVGQICDIRDHNPFQSCFPVRLVVPPPGVPDLEQRIPEGTHTKNYFECALLRRFDFVLDIEAGDVFSEHVEAIYPYRRSAFKYSQWVHRSGVSFVQVLDHAQGFLFLTNRLMAPGRMGTSLKSKEQRTGAPADEILTRMNKFCSDPQALNAFYDEEVSLLAQVPEDPPPLKI
jgi:DEP domain-containing protein 5